jgi:hypothetical protein
MDFESLQIFLELLDSGFSATTEIDAVSVKARGSGRLNDDIVIIGDPNFLVIAKAYGDCDPNHNFFLGSVDWAKPLHIIFATIMGIVDEDQIVGFIVDPGTAPAVAIGIEQVISGIVGRDCMNCDFAVGIDR